MSGETKSLEIVKVPGKGLLPTDIQAIYKNFVEKLVEIRNQNPNEGQGAILVIVDIQRFTVYKFQSDACPMGALQDAIDKAFTTLFMSTEKKEATTQILREEDKIVGICRHGTKMQINHGQEVNPLTKEDNDTNGAPPVMSVYEIKGGHGHEYFNFNTLNGGVPAYRSKIPIAGIGVSGRSNDVNAILAEYAALDHRFLNPSLPERRHWKPDNVDPNIVGPYKKACIDPEAPGKEAHPKGNRSWIMDYGYY